MENIRRGINVKKSQDFVGFFFVIAILLTVSLFLLILNKVWGDISVPLEEGLNSAIPDDSSINISKTLSQTTSSGLLFDKLMPFILIGLFAFVLIIAGSFMQHPIMIFVGIIIMAVAILLAVIYSNLYNSISSTTEFADTKASMGIQDKFMQYLPVIIFIMVIGVGSAIIYSRRGAGQL
jgi:hypothetical protein